MSLPRVGFRRAALAAAPLALLAASACRPAPASQAPAPVATPEVASADTAPGADSAGGAGERGPAARRSPGPRPYARVITKDAITKAGLFTTHLIGDKLYFEIPRAELGREMLLVSQIAKTSLGHGYGGQAAGNRVVRWQRRGDRVLLRTVSYEVVADSTLPVSRAVEAANYDPILMSFPIAAFGPDSAPVIEVTRLYTTYVPELSARARLDAGNLDPARSFVERVSSFPTNVEVEATHTFAAKPPAGGEGRSPEPGRRTPPPRSESVLMHWSMVRLPTQPMRPRLADSRVGYFSLTQQDYGRDEQRAPKRSYIVRYRLEKKDPAAAVSDPVKPITYWVDPATPSKWVPWIKKGVEDWQQAFLAAGFSNAIVAKEAPSVAEDPEWSPEDARYSVIRWLPSTIENASGPNIHDPRTGEILEADIQFYQNVMNLQRNWYFVQAAPLDKRAQRLPLPDSLMGRLLEYVVAHEVGHTLGFQHNMKASATYPADSLRSRSWLERMGHTPTLMDYSRFNYVAQPEDSIPPELLIPRIGPYDEFATKWGYAPIPGAASPDDEKPTLDRWARMQDTIPWLRFSTAGADGSDPGENTEAVGDADAVQSTALGLRNIERIVPMLIPATSRPGEDYADLAELYGRLVGQWATELGHVTSVVGGEQSQEKHAGQQGVRFTPVSAARQRAAVRFLNERAFTTPTMFLDPNILRRIEPEGALERIRTAQARILGRLLDDDRMERMVELQALARTPAEVYPLATMLDDVQRGIWGEAYAAGRVQVDPVRRNLQRAYLELVDAKLNPKEPPVKVTFDEERGVVRTPRLSSDAPALLRGELEALDRVLAGAVPRAADRTTRLHLEGMRARIEQILNPNGPATD